MKVLKNMKLIIIATIFILGGCVLFAIFYNKEEVLPPPIPDNQEIPDLTPIVMEYKYLGKAVYMDNPHYYDMLMVEPSEPFTWPEIINNERYFRETEQDYRFSYPSDLEVDFENYYLFIVFGREVRELECEYNISYRGYHMSITYEKKYQGNIVFFYEIEKRNYLAPVYSACYWMDEGEKIFLGDPFILITPQKRD